MNKLTNNYISGLIQANGSIGINLHKTKNSLRLIPYFNITQNIKNKDLILKIKHYFNDIGFIIINKSDNTIRYQVNQLNDLHHIIIPFLLRNDLRSNKHIKVIILKYIINIMIDKLHINNNSILLSLIILANKITNNHNRYLNKEQQYIVNNQIYNKDILNIIEDMELSIKNYKPSNLDLDYINGLFDGKGSLSVSLNSNKDITLTYYIIQDKNEMLLLNNIKSYFNNIGHIYNINNTSFRWETKSIVEFNKNILNKMITEDNYPLIKGYKIKHMINVLKYISDNKDYKKNNDKIRYIISELYNIIENKKGIRLDEYIKKLMK
ncbi:putative LAGLIDADG endonuclease (mitochondrion) [Ogataea philodendri]|uniref:Putative LAGLIDADG endonuclease n=1 Tax=Ogataea philodendri TaxID=1378263 RepID=S5U4V8_9ASCO|nr:putative LAGLIDADG endonuclease [Ogataea philodendri]AGS44398.1 putative LAGLIDADG endonuclease [Ogataea philodendri]